MKTRNSIIALTIFVLSIIPLAAQNSPAGGLSAGNVLNRDTDTYMMMNFAQFVNYDKFFSFAQGSMSNFAFSGFSAGYGTKVRGNLLHFYLNTNGFSLNDTTKTIDDGTDMFEETNTNKRLNLQFDTAFGNADSGIFKLGLNFSDIGQDEVYKKINTDDFTKTITKSGFFTPSLAWGYDIINNDFSMLLYGGTVRFRIPNDFGRKTEEVTSAGVTTTTTTAPALITPSVPFNASMRLEIEPQMWYFPAPKLEPFVTISHIYLLNTLIFMFYPEETKTIEVSNVSDKGYERRKHNYIGDTFFGYYNVVYSINARLTIAWRINFSAGFFYDTKDYTYTRTPGGAETLKQESYEQLYLTATIAPRLAFGLKIIPATLELNGAIVFNDLGPMNAIGWQHYRTTTTNKDNDTVETKIENIFNPIKPYITAGAAWSLNPHMTLEGGIRLNTSAAENFLKDVSISAVYKR